MSYFVETVLNAVMAYILQLIKVKENITEKKNNDLVLAMQQHCFGL